MRVEVRRAEWRTQVLRAMALVLAAFVPIPVAFGIIRDPAAFAPLLGPAAAVVVAGLVAGLARHVAVGIRALILCAPLFAFACYALYLSGPTPGVVMTFATIVVVVGLVRGATLGVIALIATAGAFGGFGALGRENGAVRLGAELPELLTWFRLALTYAGATGVMLMVVTMALRRVESSLTDLRHTEARLRASDARLRLTLEAASAGTWSLDASTRRFSWDEMVSSDPQTEPPDTLDDLLRRVPQEDRARVATEFEEVIARRRPELHIEHEMIVGQRRTWVEARGRLTRIAGRYQLVGTVADVRERRAAAERRAALQETLLRLSMSQSAAGGDLDAALREISEAGSTVLDVERCGVWRFSTDGSTLENVDLHVRKTRDHQRTEVLRAEAYPAYFAALKAQRTIAASDARSDPRTREFTSSYLVQNRITAMLDSPIHVGGQLVGVLCHEHVGDAPRRWTSDDEHAAGSLADAASRAIEAAERSRAQKQLEVAYAQLGQVYRHLDGVREEERRRMARELHDELGQTLTAVKLTLGMAARDPANAARLEEASAIVDRALHTTRELSRALRPPLLDEIGLVPALRSFVDEQARASGLQINLDAPAAPRASPEIETAAFRVVQEAVTNALRHAGAHKVEVALRGADWLEIVVHDDGHGFDPEAALGNVAPRGHLGLVGMRERARALGGRFAVRSTPAAGTEVRVELPLGEGGVQ